MLENTLGRLQSFNASKQVSKTLASVHNTISTALEYGATVIQISSLIALAGLLNWCPRCGEWQGAGSEGIGPNVPNPTAPPIPKRLLRAISSPLAGEPTSQQSTPKRDGSRLTPNSDILESFGTTPDGKDAKFRHNPLSNAHGRKVETYYDGSPRPDSDPHGHDVHFIRGDGEEFHMYDRARDGTPIHETNTSVLYQSADNTYQWEPKNQPKRNV